MSRIPALIGAAVFGCIALVASIEDPDPARAAPNAIDVAAACALAEEAPTDANLMTCHGVTKDDLLAPASWSAGYEAGWIVLCDVTASERSAWASPLTMPTNAGLFLAGIDVARADVGRDGCEATHP